VNLIDELRSLDPQEPGRWPLPIRIGAVAVWFVALTVILAYFVVWNQKQPDLERSEAEELQLREEFKTKHAKAVNLEVYKGQLKDIERSFGALLRQLPGKTEVPNLLDISQTGLAAGLKEAFQPAAERNATSARSCPSDPPDRQLSRVR
jgi:type IV pilus assembly protein PilO